MNLPIPSVSTSTIPHQLSSHLPYSHVPTPNITLSEDDTCQDVVRKPLIKESKRPRTKNAISLWRNHSLRKVKRKLRPSILWKDIMEKRFTPWQPGCKQRDDGRDQGRDRMWIHVMRYILQRHSSNVLFFQFCPIYTLPHFL